jgi:hypothetical protein
MNNAGAEYYLAYYQAQVSGRGVGGVNKYARTQRGNGIGAFFSGLFRRIMPYLQGSVSAVGSELASAGANILRDVLSGRSTRDSVTERITNAGVNLGTKASEKVNSMLGLGYKRKRKSVKGQSTSYKRRKKVSQKPRKRDIFGF